MRELLLAHSWKTDHDPTGWWMSEKLDGVRAYWDGKQFMSRAGNKFYAPAWFTVGLPDFALDGELWGGRGEFQKTVGIVKTQSGKKDDMWKGVAYVVFDAPDYLRTAGAAATFEARMAFAKSYVKARPLPHNMMWLEQERCTGFDHLRAELTRVEQLGGEGLMLRRPGSMYEAGRSHTLLKVKTFHDAEAIVRGYEEGLGRNKGRCGALVVELPNGTTFKVGTGLDDSERNTPPPIGAAITYRYQELTKDGVPRFPSFVRVHTNV